MNAHTPCDIRHDGWTGERQRAFLESVAVGATVEEACRHVGMSVSSAYALRRRAAGSAFALGWQAASLLARDRIADALTARAIDGQVDTYSRPDGSTWTRHRFDNRLASTMLARLDRQADDAAGTPSQCAADRQRLGRVAGGHGRRRQPRRRRAVPATPRAGGGGASLRQRCTGRTRPRAAARARRRRSLAARRRGYRAGGRT